MEPIADRINEIIKAKGLKKSEFAKRLGISPASVSTMCSGKSNPSGQTVTMICREFNVSEEWLRTGAGEMFLPTPVSELDALVARYNLTRGERAMIERILTMKPESRKVLMDYFVGVAASLADAAADDGVAAAEAAYEKSLNSAPGTDASLSSTSEGTA